MGRQWLGAQRLFAGLKIGRLTGQSPAGHAGSRCQNLMLVLAGIIIGQAILYGPCLVGRKILLPLDILARPGMYLPRSPEIARMVPHDLVLADLIDVDEISRRFAVSEIHAGRWPVWSPYQFAGVPFVAPKYSPLLLLQFCTASPVILAWSL